MEGIVGREIEVHEESLCFRTIIEEMVPLPHRVGDIALCSASYQERTRSSGTWGERSLAFSLSMSVENLKQLLATNETRFNSVYGAPQHVMLVEPDAVS